MMERSAERYMASHTLAETWKDFIDITKPGINASNLLATFTGYLLAAGFTGSFGLMVFIYAMTGTALVIAGGCTLNNFYDRDIDPLMKRTRTRAVPSGRMKPSTALIYGIILSVAGHLVLLFGVNLLTAVLGFIGFAVYLFIYTMWLKRTSTLNTVVGGISGAVPPVMGWVAVTGRLDLAALALFLILFLWQPPHFFALAMRKSEEYRAAGIPMLPVVKGNSETKKQILIFTILLIPATILLFVTGAASWTFLVTAIILDLIYVVLAIRGLSRKEDEDMWAKQMFLYSLFYLTVILLMMIIDVLVRQIL
jgi:protoheme IX farnesyltransferase